MNKIYERRLFFIARGRKRHENLTNLYDMPTYMIWYMLSGNSSLFGFEVPGMPYLCTTFTSLLVGNAIFSSGKTIVTE